MSACSLLSEALKDDLFLSGTLIKDSELRKEKQRYARSFHSLQIKKAGTNENPWNCPLPGTNTKIKFCCHFIVNPKIYN